MELSFLKTAENLIACSGWPGEVVHAGVASCVKVDSFLKASHITPNKISQLGDSLCIAPTIGNGTPRTCEVNGAQHRTTEPNLLADWCTVQQDTSSYSSLSCSGVCELSGLATSRPIPSDRRSWYTGFSLMTITNMRDGYQFTSVI